MSPRERLAMATVYTLVFAVLPATIHIAAQLHAQSTRESPSPVPAIPGGLALHYEEARP